MTTPDGKKSTYRVFGFPCASFVTGGRCPAFTWAASSAAIDLSLIVALVADVGVIVYGGVDVPRVIFWFPPCVAVLYSARRSMYALSTSVAMYGGAHAI